MISTVEDEDEEIRFMKGKLVCEACDHHFYGDIEIQSMGAKCPKCGSEDVSVDGPRPGSKISLKKFKPVKEK